MQAHSSHVDIAVLGGGPAGSVLAARLADLGFAVVLVNRPRRFRAVEGVSERALKGLEFAGFEAALDAVGPHVRRVAAWNGERRDANREWIVERPSFDTALLADAARHGVDVIAATARRPARTARGWRLALTAAGRTEPDITADFLVDARGRSTRRGAADWTSGPATYALARRFRTSTAHEPGTMVFTSAGGWAWLAVDAQSRALAQVFVSAERGPLPPRCSLERFYDDTLSCYAPETDFLASLVPLDRVHVRDAATAVRHVVMEDGMARVGDAAFAVDPLAGHGIFEAVAGALALAPAINTALRRPKHAALAERFYREKLHADFSRLARTGRDFYRTERRYADHPFWRERRAWPDEAPAHEAPGTARPRIEKRPVSADDFVIERDVVVTADHPRGIWRVAAVPLAELWQTVDAAVEGTADPAGAAARRLSLPRDDVEVALAWLRSRGLVEPA